MWLWTLLVGALGSQLLSQDWEASDQAQFSTHNFTLNPPMAQSKGQLRHKVQQQATTLEAKFAFQSSCPRSRDTQGLALLLSTQPLQSGRLFGAHHSFEGVMVMVNHRSLEVGMVLGDGKRQIRDSDSALKCAYLDPKVNTTVRLSLSKRKLSLFIGPESRLCGSIDFPWERFFVGLSGSAASQPCSNTIYDFALEIVDQNPSLNAIGENIGEMEEEIADVIGEIGEMLDEFS